LPIIDFGGMPQAHLTRRGMFSLTRRRGIC
jgi:hypothetical protein